MKNQLFSKASHVEWKLIKVLYLSRKGFGLLRWYSGEIYGTTWWMTIYDDRNLRFNNTLWPQKKKWENCSHYMIITRVKCIYYITFLLLFIFIYFKLTSFDRQGRIYKHYVWCMENKNSSILQPPGNATLFAIE